MISEHAIDRFIERWHPTATRGIARAFLHQAATFARKVADDGPGQWIGEFHDMLMVIGTADGEVRTVLPRGTVWRTRR